MSSPSPTHLTGSKGLNYYHKQNSFTRIIFPALLLLTQWICSWILFDYDHYLGDQNDILQQARALFRGELWALYGPYMSQSDPVVRNAGPFGVILTAWIPAIGMPWEWGRLFLIATISFAILPFYFQLKRLSTPVAILFSSLYVAAPLHSWLFSAQ